MSITIKDIAKKANVSITTVSRVLNNKPEGVGAATRKRVRKIIKEHNYRPNITARSMITKQTATFGLIIPDIRNPFFPELVRGVEDYSNRHQYNVFLCNTDGDTQREIEYLRLMKEKNVDGIIYTYSYTSMEKKVADLFLTNDIPAVLLDRGLDDGKFSQVYIDNEKAGYIATKHLIEHSHRHIGCIIGPAQIQNSVARLEGYKRAMNDFDLMVDEAWIVSGEYQMEGGYKAAKQILKDESVTAIFAFNDLMAFGVYQAAMELKINIPKDLSVVGFDNIKYNELLVPKLTTIEQPTYQMGEIATDLLLQQIQGKSNAEKKTVLLEPSLIIRDSTWKL